MTTQFQLKDIPASWQGEIKRTECSATPVLTRNGGDASFNFIKMEMDLGGLLKSDSRLMTGFLRFGETLKKFETEQVGDNELTADWMLFRLSENDFLMAGIASWRVFPVKLNYRSKKLVADFCGAGKPFAEGAATPMEDIFCCRAASEQEALDAYNDFLVKNLNIKLNVREFRGWSDWDYYTGNTRDVDALDNIRRMKEICPSANFIQFDAGFAVLDGDWLDISKYKYPNGMGAVIQEARKKGMEVGIWLAPFYVDFKSKILKEHPEWVQHRKDGAVRGLGAVDTAVMDYSQDETIQYLKDCVKYFKDLGVTFFKLDFVNAGCAFGEAKNPMTPYERIHRCLNAIREAAGEDAYLLGGSTEYGPCLGHIDGQRVGPDIGPSYGSVKCAIASAMASIHYHGKLFQCDVDYLVTRGEGMTDELCQSGGKQARLNSVEAKLWSDFVMLAGNSRMDSDKLSLLTPERIQMVRECLENPVNNDDVRVMDYWRGGLNESPLMIYSEGRIGIFNLYDTEKEYTLPNGETVTLAPHASRIITGVEWDGRQIPGTEVPLVFDSQMGEPFTGAEKAQPLPLGPAARYRVSFDFEYGSEVLEDVYSPLCLMDSFLGVPMSVGPDAITIKDVSADEYFDIPVDREVSVLYILHSAAYPLRGEWMKYILTDEDGREYTFQLTAGYDLGVTDYQYTRTLGNKSSRIAWHNSEFVKGAFLTEWKLEKKCRIKNMRVTRPVQQGMHILLAVSTLA